MKQKVEKQRFLISEFREEAAWLSFMHREGWKFVSTDGGKYRFEPCEGEDFIYQLDFKKNGVAEDDYIQMFADYGWDYVFRFRKWFYFRKKRTTEEEDLSIFSDKESKIEFCKRVIGYDIIRVLPILLLLLATNYLLFFTSLAEKSDFLQGAKYGVVSGTAIALVFSLSVTINQYKRLYQMIRNYENPIK